MNQQARFTRFEDCTEEDCAVILENHKAFAADVADRVISHLKLLNGDFGGFQVDRLEHSLQTATRALRDGKDEEYVVCALLHDIGDTLGPLNHGGVAAAILQPYISDANHWMISNHTIFQGYYYYEFMGLDKNAREQHKDNPHYQHTLEFIEKYDMPTFDKEYDSMTLEEFTPIVRRVMSK